MQADKNQNPQEIAQKLGLILGDLEKQDEQPQNLGQLVQKCQEYQKQLEDIFLGQQTRYKKVSQNNLKMLKQFQERINKQEQNLIDKGQDIIGEMLINKLKSSVITLENEEYFTEIEKNEIERKCQQYCQQLQYSLKFIKNKGLSKKIQNYLENYEKKKNLKEIAQKDNNLSENDLIAQFSVLDGISQLSSTDENQIQQQQQLQLQQQEKQDEKMLFYVKNNKHKYEQQRIKPPQFTSQKFDEYEIKTEDQITEQIMVGDKFDKNKLNTILDDETLEENQQNIDKIQKDMYEILQLQQDINFLTNQNGEKIESITDQLENTLENTKQSTEQMRQAYIDSQKIRRAKIKAFFTGIGGVLGFGIFGGVGAAIGIGGGQAIGQGVGKLVTDKNMDKFDEDDKNEIKNQQQQQK